MEEYNFVEENLNKNIFDDIDAVFNMYVDDVDGTFTPYSTPIDPSQPPIFISDICFPKHTLIATDQGEIMIELINCNLHTITNKKIKAITKTISTNNYLVCFEKNSIHFNYPSNKTIMSKNHKIKYNGEFCKADTFLKKNKTIYKIKYNGEILYNVLMEENSIMKVNNLICETLDTNSKIAILYNNFDKKYIYTLKPYKPIKKMYIKFN